MGNDRETYRRKRRTKRQESISPFYIFAVSAVILIIAGIAIKKGDFRQNSAEQTTFEKYLSTLGSGNYENTAVDGAAVWAAGDNTGKLNTSEENGARDHFTEIYGDGDDNVTIMIYMCGSDLESIYGMASADIQEMLAADIGEKINVLVYTGGSNGWQQEEISAQYNQIYKVENGKLNLIESNMGNQSMTNQGNLATFIAYCKKNYPANRNNLILWGHGGGSLSGFGYDIKNNGRGAMTVSGIAQAIKNSDITFDFVGFDTGMMATYENAMILSEYADYMIASEETETGTGWNYTGWLTALSENPAYSTIELGMLICDEYVEDAQTECPGQKAALSVIDLADLSYTTPEKVSAFSSGTKNLISSGEYEQVALARAAAREFASDALSDQIDLVHFAKLINSTEAQELSSALLGSVKYNAVSQNMTNAYGLSIYFPFHDLSYVDTAITILDTLDVVPGYTDCIREFAGLMACGQIANGGADYAVPAFALFSNLNDYNGVYRQENLEAAISLGDQDTILQMLNDFVKSSSNQENRNYVTGRSVDNNQAAEYIAGNYFDPTQLTWTENEKGDIYLTLPDDQWQLIDDVSLNLFYNDGTGYIDLGLDQMYDFDRNGNLEGTFDNTWLHINGQVVPYYFANVTGEGDECVITGYVPALLNGEKIHLIISFDRDHLDGNLAGVIKMYDDSALHTRAKSVVNLQEGDLLEFTAHYYDYDGNEQESYAIGEQITVNGDLKITREEISRSQAVALYRFTDIYGQAYWTQRIY